MLTDWIIHGLTWLIHESQVVSHIAQRLIDRHSSNDGGERTPIVIEIHPPQQHTDASDPILDRLIAPPPARLLFFNDSPTNSVPVIAVVLSDGQLGGNVAWVLSEYDVPVNLELPDNAIAVLFARLLLDPSRTGKLVLGEFHFETTVDGYQVYTAL